MCFRNKYCWNKLFVMPLFTLIYLEASFFVSTLCADEMDNSQMVTGNGLKNVSHDICALKYLERYGYLLNRGEEADNITSYSEVDLTHAIRTFQKFGGLKETGSLDNKTGYLMSQPRCGFLDILPHTDRTLPVKLDNSKIWESKVITWKISTFSTKLPIDQQRQAIENSVRYWSDNSGLTIMETTDEDANINIKFVTKDLVNDTAKLFDGPGRIVARAFLPPDGHVLFNDDEIWTFNNGSSRDLEMVAIHEIGHSLGLVHSMDLESVMTPFFKKYKKEPTLHQVDIAAIQELYGPPTIKEDMNSTGQSRNSSDTNTNSTDLVDKKNAKKIKTFDICRVRFDAVCGGKDGLINVFVRRNIYKVYPHCEKGHNCIVEGYPKLIRDVYRKGPKRVHAAAYIPDVRKRTYLFKGRKVWRYTGRKLDAGYPVKLKSSDLPYKPSAVYVQKSQYADYQLYLFKGKRFWEMNLDSNKVVAPTFLTETYWNRMPKSPDAIIQTKDGNIYVFKGKHYRKYDYRRSIVSKKTLKAPAWIGRQCGFADKNDY